MSSTVPLTADVALGSTRSVGAGGIDDSSSSATRHGSILITDPDYCGSLAASRALGAAGITVWSAGASPWSVCGSSRFVTRHFAGLPTGDPQRQAAWLADFGERHPGTVLYPTSDEHAWMQALHAERLRQRFQMYTPPVEAIEALLDKRRLHEACAAVGIDTPTTHFAESQTEVADIARRARFPVLLKQRTQLYSRTHSKGRLIRDAAALGAAYRRFVDDHTHHAAVTRRMPFASWPLVQEFHADARERSYVVSGFVDHTHERFAALAAFKVLQYPRTLGVGLCLESAPLDEDLAARLRALCRHVGYFGVFQVELLLAGPRKLLIDFNPRFYHFMGFDMARGLPLARLAYLAAAGDADGLSNALASAKTSPERTPDAFTHGIHFTEMLLAQRLSGRMRGAEIDHWRRWRRSHQGRLLDAVYVAGDSAPAWTCAALTIWSRLRHPRAFLREIVLDL